MPTSDQSATQLLEQSGRGEAGASDRLTPIVYQELREIASRYLAKERPDHTLQPTALVHEAYLRLIDQSRAGPADQTHFIGLAAHTMRQVLVDYARKKKAQKRGGDRQRITWIEGLIPGGEDQVDLLALEDALNRLADLDERKARLVELRFYGGMTVEEAARLLDVSLSTAEGDWRMARAWLRRELAEDGDDGNAEAEK